MKSSLDKRYFTSQVKKNNDSFSSITKSNVSSKSKINTDLSTWEAQFKAAIKVCDKPEADMFEAMEMSLIKKNGNCFFVQKNILAVTNPPATCNSIAAAAKKLILNLLLLQQILTLPHFRLFGCLNRFC